MGCKHTQWPAACAVGHAAGEQAGPSHSMPTLHQLHSMALSGCLPACKAIEACRYCWSLVMLCGLLQRKAEDCLGLFSEWGASLLAWNQEEAATLGRPPSDAFHASLLVRPCLTTP